METRANYALLGGVTVAGFFLAMLFAMWLARASFNREFAIYDVVFDGPARGIGKGTEVRFNGIRVGEVSSLFMDPGHETSVVARVRIGADWPVRTDSAVRLEPVGLTGLNLIQISSGEGKAPLLRRRLGDDPPRIAAKGAALDEILASGEGIAQNANDALLGAKGMLTPDNAARFQRILKNLEDVSRTLAAERGVLNNANAAAQDLRVSARQFTETAREIEELAKDGRRTIGNLDVSASRALASIDGAANGVNAAASVVADGTLPELTAASRDMRRLATTLDRVAGNVERSSTLAAVGEQKPIVRVNP